MNVAIAGYGIEGKANLSYWQRHGHEVTILDEKPVSEVPDGTATVIGVTAFDDVSGYDVVVRTASLRPDRLATATKVWSATNEFFEHCPAPIVGVTGTKGKGTTSSLVVSILRAAGKTVHLVGNIGVPALEVLPRIQPDDIVVFELSSFQLWDLERSPHVAVVLMIEPDHLDVHTDMNEYVAAKSNIVRFQTHADTVVYHPTNHFSAQVVSRAPGHKVRFAAVEDGGVYVQENNFCVRSERICSVEAVQLPGQHNLENACAAITAARVFGVDNHSVEKGLRDFRGLPHRLKFIREMDGVRYYDDNYSSAPGATIAAVRSFTESEVLILGGYDRKIDLTYLADSLQHQANLCYIVLMGQTRHALHELLSARGLGPLCVVDGSQALRPIVERARSLAEPGSVVIMSPGCASFDMFKNFTDRGDQFIEIVEGF